LLATRVVLSRIGGNQCDSRKLALLVS
jgi:hypothetical protein